MKKRKYIVVSVFDPKTGTTDWVGAWDNTPEGSKNANACYFCYLGNAEGTDSKVRRFTADTLPDALAKSLDDSEKGC
jgi:hypothetical protein